MFNKWVNGCLIIILLFSIFETAFGQLDTEQVHTSSSQCFLGGSIPLDCGSDKIAILNFIAGRKLTTSGCMNTDTTAICCTYNATSDCITTLINDDNTDNVEFCLGHDGSCAFNAFNTLTSACNDSYNGPLSNYIYTLFYCIENSKIYGIGDGTVQASHTDAIVYATNSNFEIPGFSTQQNQHVFTVQSNDSTSEITVYTILRSFGSDVNVTFVDVSGTILLTWTITDNTYNIENTTLHSSSLIVTINVNGFSNTTKFWIGFKGSVPGSTLSIRYPSNVPGDSQEEDSLPVYLIVVITLCAVLGVYLIVAAIIIIFIKKQNLERVNPTVADQSEPSTYTTPSPNIDGNNEIINQRLEVPETPQDLYRHLTPDVERRTSQLPDDQNMLGSTERLEVPENPQDLYRHLTPGVGRYTSQLPDDQDMLGSIERLEVPENPQDLYRHLTPDVERRTSQLPDDQNMLGSTENFENLENPSDMYNQPQSTNGEYQQDMPSRDRELVTSTLKLPEVQDDQLNG